MRAAKINNGVVEVDAEMFIIPNDLMMVKNMSPRMVQFANELLQNSGKKEMNLKDKTFEAWIISEELDTQNLRDHGGRAFNESGEEVDINIPKTFIPVKLVSDKKEGDIIDLIYMDNGIKVILHTKLNQSDYRYRIFGTFDECLEKLLEVS